MRSNDALQLGRWVRAVVVAQAVGVVGLRDAAHVEQLREGELRGRLALEVAPLLFESVDLVGLLLQVARSRGSGGTLHAEHRQACERCSLRRALALLALLAFHLEISECCWHGWAWRRL